VAKENKKAVLPQGDRMWHKLGYILLRLDYQSWGSKV